MVQRLFSCRAADASDLSPSTYALLALSVVSALAVAAVTGVRFHDAPSAALCPLLALAAAGYLRGRSETFGSPRIVASAAFIGTMSLFGIAAAGMLYGAQAFAMPLRDDLFRAIDAALGFEWLAVQRFMVERSGLIAALGLCYGSFFVQLSVVPLLLIATGRVRRADRFMASWMLCVVVAAALSALLPCAGGASLVAPADAHLLFSGATPLDQLFGLRDGSMRSFALDEIGPLTSFPSLHCAAACLATAAVWPLARLRWAVAALNAAMTVSALTHGAHYLCDCIAGLLVAAVSFQVAGRLGPWSEAAFARLRRDGVVGRAPSPGLAT